MTPQPPKPDTGRAAHAPAGPAALLVATIVIACALVSCGRRETRAPVVLYVSADQHVAREVVAAFEEASGLRVLMVGDTEATKATGLVERIRAERDNPQADVFWSSELFMTIALADEGMFEPYEPPANVGRPDFLRDPENRWHGFASRARVIVYNTQRVAPEDVPSTWLDLGSSRWKDRIVMADPRFGTTGGHLGAMRAYWDENLRIAGYYLAFIDKLADNRVRLLPSGNAGVVEAVASGEADVGMTDTDDVWAAQRNGLPVDLVFPRHHVDADRAGAGTLVIPNTVARVAGGPNPDAAARLIDFLLSAEVERLLAESDSRNIPTRSDVAAEFPQLAVEDPLVIDFRRAAALRQRAVDLAIRRLRERADEEAAAEARDAG